MEDWKPFDGREQPVPDNAIVDLMLERYGEFKRRRAGDWTWEWRSEKAGPGAIVAYRLAPTASSS